MALNNGALIADRYRLIRLIATGGMGQVWEATDSRLNRRVAVKVLKSEFSSDPEFLERFRFEARTTAQLNHPGIAGIYDYGETRDSSGDSTAYLVMELVNGEPLNAVLARVGRLAVPHALDMLEQTGRALQVAHDAGVVHRDVKPGNILITPTGQVKITDFGIAKAVENSPVTRTGMVMGTAQYIAPEQALGQDATAASDVYSLGIVGYEALSGRRPFTGDGALTVAMKHVQETPAPMPADLPPNIRELIDITLTKDPAGRYASGGEFADAVAAVRAGEASTAARSARHRCRERVAGYGCHAGHAADVRGPGDGRSCCGRRGSRRNDQWAEGRGMGRRRIDLVGVDHRRSLDRDRRSERPDAARRHVHDVADHHDDQAHHDDDSADDDDHRADNNDDSADDNHNRADNHHDNADHDNNNSDDHNHHHDDNDDHNDH